jgi:hypothetical protein
VMLPHSLEEHRKATSELVLRVGATIVATCS